MFNLWVWSNNLKKVVSLYDWKYIFFEVILFFLYDLEHLLIQSWFEYSVVVGRGDEEVRYVESTATYPSKL